MPLPVTLDAAETKRWQAAAVAVEADWVKEVQGKNIDGAKLVAEALRVFYDMRKVPGLKKKPSTSELLDWLKLLMVEDMSPDALRSKDRSRIAAAFLPYDKAGGYGIQGPAAIFIESIRGSHSGIMGLSIF